MWQSASFWKKNAQYKRGRKWDFSTANIERYVFVSQRKKLEHFLFWRNVLKIPYSRCQAILDFYGIHFKALSIHSLIYWKSQDLVFWLRGKFEPALEILHLSICVQLKLPSLVTAIAVCSKVVVLSLLLPNVSLFCDTSYLIPDRRQSKTLTLSTNVYK